MITASFQTKNCSAFCTANQSTKTNLKNLLEENDGSDFIFYPQIEKKTICPILGICFINRVSTVEVKSKLGTFK